MISALLVLSPVVDSCKIQAYAHASQSAALGVPAAADVSAVSAVSAVQTSYSALANSHLQLKASR